jgi:hypothetical protein
MPDITILSHPMPYSKMVTLLGLDDELHCPQEMQS